MAFCHGQWGCLLVGASTTVATLASRFGLGHWLADPSGLVSSTVSITAAEQAVEDADERVFMLREATDPRHTSLAAEARLELARKLAAAEAAAEEAVATLEQMTLAVNQAQSTARARLEARFVARVVSLESGGAVPDQHLGRVAEEALLLLVQLATELPCARASKRHEVAEVTLRRELVHVLVEPNTPAEIEYRN